MKIKYKIIDKLDLLEVIEFTKGEIYIETQNEQEFKELHERLINLNIELDLNKGVFKQGCGYIILNSRNFGVFDTKSAINDGATIYKYS